MHVAQIIVVTTTPGFRDSFFQHRRTEYIIQDDSSGRVKFVIQCFSKQYNVSK